MIFFAGCNGFESKTIPADNGSVIFSSQTKDGKIVYGARDALNKQIIPPAYDTIIASKGQFLGKWSDKKNIMSPTGQVVFDKPFSRIEVKENYFLCTAVNGLYVYFPETDAKFGPCQDVQANAEWLFLKNDNGWNIAQPGLPTAVAKILIVKDAKSGKNYIVTPGKVNQVYDAEGKADKKISARSLKNLEKALKDTWSINDDLKGGTVPDFKKF